MAKIIIESISDKKRKDLGLPDELGNNDKWSVWECEPSKFDWHYDSTELAYLFEGKVVVKTAEEEVEIKAGDYVTFPSGLDCSWDISEKIKKVYQFIN